MIKETIIKAIEKALKDSFGLEREVVHLEIPAQKQFGDFACNIAMSLSKSLKKNPREIGETLKNNIQFPENFIQEINLAGPGFLNFKLSPKVWVHTSQIIQNLKNQFGTNKENLGKSALVEFVSANPTGPLHIGHGRNAVVGDCLARLLEANGFKVEREYYVNDGGIQITNLGKSVWARLLELKGHKIDFPEEGYQGDYIIELSKQKLNEFDSLKTLNEADRIQKLGRWAGDEILSQINNDLKNIDVAFKTHFFEHTLYDEGKVSQTLAEMKQKQITYEKDGALWLKSTDYGDDKDRVLIKSDGSMTYLTPDIAYHRDKFKRGHHIYINVLGGDHAGYAPRLKAALKGLGYDVECLHIVFIQMVSLIKDGQQVSMSTRRATYETLEDVVAQVGSDVARTFFMMRSYNAQMEFDLKLAKEQSSDNPAYYIQYAHARICSIFKKAVDEKKSDGIWPEFEENFSAHLILEEEINLIRKLLEYPELIQKASSELAPHRIPTYLLELVRDFQSYYDKARVDNRYKILSGNENEIKSKLYLLGCIRQVIANALKVMGVNAPERM